MQDSAIPDSTRAPAEMANLQAQYFGMVSEADHQLGRIWAALESSGQWDDTLIIVTADHGNCETMVDPVTGEPHTAHTTNPVPVILVGGPPGVHLRDGGRLADLAPTLLELMGLPLPPEMTGKSLIAR